MTSEWKTEADFDSSSDSIGIRNESSGDGTANAIENGYPRSSQLEVSSGLVGWWPLNEESGSIAYDLANGNDGTINGATVADIPGIGGTPTYSFDGTDDNVDLGNLDYSGTDLTICAWVYPEELNAGTFYTIYSSWQSSTGIQFLYDNDEYWYTIVDGVITARTAGNAGVNLNEWSHMVTTFKSGTSDNTIVIDGVEVTSSTGSTTLTQGGTHYIGEKTISGGGWNGKLQDVRVYNQALSASEIQTIYENGNPYAIEQATASVDQARFSGDVSRYSMDDSDVSGSTLTDSWGSNDGTINGATTGVSGVGGGEAFSFDGIDDDVDTGIQSITTPLTLSCWITPDDVNTDQHIISNWASTGDDLFLRIGEPSGSTDRWDFQHDQGGRVLTSNGYPVNGETVFICGVIDTVSNGMKFYVNGVEVGSDDGVSDTINNGSNFHIGGGSNGGKEFDGEIDEVRIYNTALNQSQVWQLYNIGRNMSEVTLNE